MTVPPMILEFLRRWWPVLAGGLFVVLLLSLTYCKGESAGRNKEIVKQQETTIKIERDAGTADAAAADKRVQDTITITEQKKELDDAIETGEDPATLRARRGCLIMRQQRRDTSKIAACRRFEVSS